MNWTRYKLLIISGGITLVISGVLLFWILSSRSENEEVNTQIRSLSNRQSQLSSEVPYPSKPNYEQLLAEQAKVVEQRNQLISIIKEGELQPPQVSRSRFGDYVRGEVVPFLRKEAKESKKGGEHGVILDDPDFGLTAYLTGTLPETSKIPELLLQIETMEHISLLLFTSGISELNLVEVVESETADTSRTSRTDRMGNRSAVFDRMRLPGRRGEEPEETDDDGKGDILKEKERMFEWTDYRLEFKVYEDFFWDTLNAMISDSNQLVVTELYVTNSNRMLWPEYLEPVLGKENMNRRAARTRPTRREQTSDLFSVLQGDDPESEAPVEKVEVQIAGLSERRQNVVGGDLLNVAMVVRVYRLSEKASVEKASETEEGN